MRRVLLYGRRMTSMNNTHEMLRSRFRFPEYYGKNLDALYDLLSSACQETIVLLFDHEAMLRHMEHEGRALLQTLRDAALHNLHLRLVLVHPRYPRHRKAVWKVRKKKGPVGRP